VATAKIAGHTHTHTHIYIYKEACKLVCLWIQLVYHRAEVMAYDSLKAATNNSRAFHIQTFKVILASLVSASHRPWPMPCDKRVALP